MSVSFVFPGQGSQSVGMLADLAESYPQIDAAFEEASDAIGVDLYRIVREGPDTDLASTSVTQPALLTASYALWQIWCSQSPIRPQQMAGHSLGEYSALVCSGAIAFADGVRLVRRRGELMQKAVPDGEGTMAAILGLDEADIIRCCEEVDGVVSPANYNAPGQIVIAGTRHAVEQAVEACQQAGAKRAVLLDVSGPFHCALMLPARDEFAQTLSSMSISMPTIPVVQNVDAAIAADLNGVTDRLLKQLAEPVRWSSCVATMIGNGSTSFVECGPGKVLSGLNRRIDRSVTSFNIDTTDGLHKAIAEIA
ncbi:MAG: ACP S-malonyltransferase [Proteobacteria bacterium]|nr:ACP S-malonyltransferase [Pseudomonadota bacterium]